MAAFAAVDAGIGLAPDFAVAAALMACNGFFVTMWNVVTVTLRQRSVPAELLGRVNSAYRMLGWGLMPLGALAGGFIAHAAGVRAAYVVAGVLSGEFKEFTGFYSPFDIRGTVFIVYRYVDPHRADDGWAYIPNLRRVRRISSAEVKSDSSLGTDHTIEDFYSFSGRELEWHWRLLGWKDQLAVQDSAHEYAPRYGPNGIIPNDTWTMRRFAVIERTPISERHPYKSVVEDWDSQNWDAWLMGGAFRSQGQAVEGLGVSEEVERDLQGRLAGGN